MLGLVWIALGAALLTRGESWVGGLLLAAAASLSPTGPTASGVVAAPVRQPDGILSAGVRDQFSRLVERSGTWMGVCGGRLCGGRRAPRGPSGARGMPREG